MTALRLKNIWKKFGSETAVAGVSVDVNTECLALLGPSGCGKTTTINMVAGFIAPDSGSVLVGDKDITSTPPHQRNTGMVFQDYALFPHKTVAENVAFGLRMRGVSKTSRDQQVGETLELVGLSRLGNRYPDQISGGQRQRVALARALVIRPSILLLDEPLSNLDARLRESLREEIRRVLDATRITSVFVTHDQSEAFAIADRVALMNSGQIVQIGTAKELYQRPVNRFVAEFFGDCNFLPAKNSKGDGEFVSAETSGGVVRVRSANPGDWTGKPSLTIAVRPEQLLLEKQGSPNSDDTNSLPASISKVRYLGAVTRIEVKLQDSTILKIDQHRSSDWAPGQSVDVRWSVEDGVVLAGDQ